MKTKQETIAYLTQQINEKKAVVEYTKKQPFNPMHDVIIEDWKEEIRCLLTALEIVLEA
jgi:hypothetical protein